MPTDIITRMWNHLQLLIPTTHRSILTNHTCLETGPLAVLSGDLHRQRKRTINTMEVVRASYTVVYITVQQMRVLHHSSGHHTPYL